MAINPVSFKADSFYELINKEQAYPAQTAAAAKVKGDEFKKSHKGLKTIAGLAGIAAIAIGTLAYVSQKPDLVNKIKGYKFIQENESLRNFAKSAKKFGEGVYDGAKKLFVKAPEVIQQTADDVVETI